MSAIRLRQPDDGGFAFIITTWVLIVMVLAWACFASGCIVKPTHGFPPDDPQPPITYTVACDIAPADLAIIYQAADLWRDYMGHVVFERTFCDSAAEWRIDVAPDRRYGENGTVFYGVTEYGDHVVTFYDDWRQVDDVMRVRIVAHELGHVLGLQHTAGHPECLMYGTTDEDRDQASPWIFC